MSQNETPEITPPARTVTPIRRLSAETIKECADAKRRMMYDGRDAEPSPVIDWSRKVEYMPAPTAEMLADFDAADRRGAAGN